MGIVEAAFAIFGLSVLLASSLTLLTALWLARPRGRRPRRGGSDRRPASTRPRFEDTSGDPMNGRLSAAGAAGFSSSGAPGIVSVAWVIPRAQRDPSRLTERGWSTLGTVAHGTNGQRRKAAA